MDLAAVHRSEARFDKYVAGLVEVIGHADRAEPLRDYCVGLLMPGERKSVEPMAAVTAPARVAAQHQSLLHLVANAPWSDAAVMAKVCQMVLPSIERHGPIEAWIIDDTGFPKKGRHSVGVARQYCGQLGKQDNCQVAVSLSLANHGASLPMAYRLYVPHEWIEDAERRRNGKIPEDITFKSKNQIALEQIKQARQQGLPQGVVLMDAGYGNNSNLREGITQEGLLYVAGIVPTTTVWAPGTLPLPPAPWTGRGRPGTRLRRDDTHQPVSVKSLALQLPQDAWQTIAWREGTNETLSGRFARCRVRPAHRDDLREAVRPQEWLLIEWPEGEAEPTKYWLSTLPEEISFERLVDLTKLRWRIERDYQELKQEVGLGHYEGRGWRGFHHHATLCIAAYGFLISEREAIPPSAPWAARMLQKPAIPDRYRPRGAADPARTAYPELDRDNATTPHRRSRQEPATMSVLQRAAPTAEPLSSLMTQ
jgi:SRSO17 transposase